MLRADLSGLSIPVNSVAGVAAAIEAGIAIGLLGESSLVDNLEILGPEPGFKETSVSRLVLASSETADSDTVTAMKEAIRAHLKFPETEPGHGIPAAVTFSNCLHYRPGFDCLIS